jgi:hypothetical protein
MKTLLGTVAAAALVVGMSGAAWAHDYDNNHHNYDPSTSSTAVAIALGGAESEYNTACLTCSDASNTISSNAFNNASGAFNVGENAGANSAVNNTMAVASVLCSSCATDNLAVAVGASWAESEHNGAHLFGSNASNSISSSFQGASGAFNVSQNAGANSVVTGTMAIGSTNGTGNF